MLALKLRTKKQIAWVFGGKYDPATIPDDKQALADYYRGLGYFDIKIDHEMAFSKDKSKVYLGGTSVQELIERYGAMLVKAGNHHQVLLQKLGLHGPYDA